MIDEVRPSLVITVGTVSGLLAPSAGYSFTETKRIQRTIRMAVGEHAHAREAQDEGVDDREREEDAPRLDGQQLRGHPSDVGRHRNEILGAHPGGQQRLVRVAEGRVGDGHGILGAQCGGEADPLAVHQQLAAQVAAALE